MLMRITQPLSPGLGMQFTVLDPSTHTVNQLKMALGLLQDQQDNHPGLYLNDRQRRIRLVDRFGDTVYDSESTYDITSVVTLMALLGICE
jgi:hypothetical protein